VLLAVVVAPGLEQAGFEVLSVHLFIMYCGMLSYITPPVAIAAYQASIIGRADPMKTGFVAMRLGILLFFIPILFIYDPAFILHAKPLQVIHAIGTAIPGVILLGSGVEGYLIGVGRLGIPARILSFIGGVALLVPFWPAEVMAAILIIGVIVYQKLAGASATKAVDHGS
jgi:TRAP-type uncharacterized transport system fused permease subunit